MSLTPDSPTCWSAALSMSELREKLMDEYSWMDNPKFTDMPKDKDFPILFTTRTCKNDDLIELTFFGYRDAKYLLSLKGIHVA